MSIKDFLSPDHVSVDVRVSEKTKLLRELARQAAAAIDVPADQFTLSCKTRIGSMEQEEG
jgi:hypothetical protein